VEIINKESIPSRQKRSQTDDKNSDSKSSRREKRVVAIVGDSILKHVNGFEISTDETKECDRLCKTIPDLIILIL